MNRKRLMRGMLATAAAATLLAGCHSSGDDTEGPTPPPANPPPAAVTDAFIDTVRVTILASPDDTEAAPIDGIVATMPEDKEPVAP